VLQSMVKCAGKWRRRAQQLLHKEKSRGHLEQRIWADSAHHANKHLETPAPSSVIEGESSLADFLLPQQHSQRRMPRPLPRDDDEVAPAIPSAKQPPSDHPRRPLPTPLPDSPTTRSAATTTGLARGHTADDFSFPAEASKRGTDKPHRELQPTRRPPRRQLPDENTISAVPRGQPADYPPSWEPVVREPSDGIASAAPSPSPQTAAPQLQNMAAELQAARLVKQQKAQLQEELSMIEQELEYYQGGAGTDLQMLQEVERQKARVVLQLQNAEREWEVLRPTIEQYAQHIARAREHRG